MCCNRTQNTTGTKHHLIKVKLSFAFATIAAICSTAVNTNAEELVSPVDIPSTVINTELFTTLVAGLTAADLVSAVAEPNSPFTLFAPSDDAFAALPEGLVMCLLKEENVDALSAILTYHVFNGAVLSTDLTDGMMAPTLQVTTADIMTSNGVIHIIDAVLVPPSIDAAAFLETCKQGVVDSVIGM
ncbi:FAS1 domain-containing protein [Fragilariopsis cylindrus CCMP1102]|uniref:FAS1 domain-containing protein n=1 Tax=Fragilariopsis cylindrus CCMP1102 TaxID=635003 RepID=A0A1E7EWV3_9STRA|nr:FAS1 domain-containing protein [Fragilariopsis cylindrus CCMP1102]|eukprot:OEU10336.1 FAS1 domain-containing protein [Fragilariopsis cylindrus CCMP1102]